MGRVLWRSLWLLLVLLVARRKSFVEQKTENKVPHTCKTYGHDRWARAEFALHVSCRNLEVAQQAENDGG